MSILYFTYLASVSLSCGVLGGFLGVKVSNKLSKSKFLQKRAPNLSTRESIRILMLSKFFPTGFTLGASAGFLLFMGGSLMYFGVKAGEYERQQESLRLKINNE
jgi:hypothetical protein